MAPAGRRTVDAAQVHHLLEGKARVVPQGFHHAEQRVAAGVNDQFAAFGAKAEYARNGGDRLAKLLKRGQHRWRRFGCRILSHAGSSRSGGFSSATA
jgi:hypothetical protein